jgi:hypothetical protein
MLKLADFIFYMNGSNRKSKPHPDTVTGRDSDQCFPGMGSSQRTSLEEASRELKSRLKEETPMPANGWKG